MPIVMDPAKVLTLTSATASANDIALASDAILNRTGYTPDDNVDVRGLSSVSVETGWAIIAGRVHTKIVESATTSARPVSESEGDYSYSVDRRDLFADADLFAGFPLELFQLGTSSSWSRAITGGVPVPDHPFWSEIDQQFPGWVDGRDPTGWEKVYPET